MEDLPLDEALLVDSCEEKSSYLVERGSGIQVRVSASALLLLRAVAAGISFDDLARQLSRRQQPVVRATELETAYRELERRMAEIESLVLARRRLPRGFWCAIPLLSPRWTQRLATWLGRLFHPLAVLAVAGAVAVLAMVALLPRAVHLHALEGSVLPAYGLFIISLLFHELGHAAACARYGAPPSGIGFTLYLIYPAFFSDVSAAWRLKRWQRVVVDVGGAYFQVIAGCLFAGLFLLTGWQPWRLTVWAIVYSIFFSLNPVLKFDGYWVVADALGVVNLGSQPLRIARHLLARLLRRRPEPLPWPSAVTASLAVYSVASVAVWAWFLWRLGPALWHNLQGYPGRLVRFHAALASPSGAWVAALLSLLGATLLLSVSLVMAWRVLMALGKGLRTAVRRLAAVPAPGGSLTSGAG